MMSNRPEPIRVKVINERRCGGIMTADLGSIDDRVVLKCRDCGATVNVDGNDYALGLHDSDQCLFIEKLTDQRAIVSFKPSVKGHADEKSGDGG